MCSEGISAAATTHLEERWHQNGVAPTRKSWHLVPLATLASPSYQAPPGQATKQLTDKGF